MVKTDDLHGKAPDGHPVALLLVDVINPLDFPEANDFAREAIPTIKRIAALKARAKDKQIPVIYANDNFGRWRSDLAAVVGRCKEASCKGKDFCEALAPDEQDYFVLKPMHSAFYSTTLDLLLQSLGTKVLIICGYAADICVLFSANDAFMRGYQVVVPADCVASNTAHDTENVLRLMAKVLKAEIYTSAEVDLARLSDRRP